MRDAARRPDYAIMLMPTPCIAPVICAMCREPHFAGHVCPALRDLSPMGGGPKP